ncbi:hypothetical protein HDE_13119 [Halotydeus destructor]|nr:hypothetical protein HDE_13119 [Halotydeus destructor]
MSSKLVKFLDYDNSLLTDFVKNFYRDGCQVTYPSSNRTKLRFDVNEKRVSVLAVEDEIRDSMSEVYNELVSIPVAGEITDPTVLTTNQSWCEYVAKSIPSWRNFCPSAHIIYFYRRITTPEYQTQDHMRLVYVACTAFEFATNACSPRGQMMDGQVSSESGPTWHREHPQSACNDLLVLTDMARLVMKHIIPKDHPCHGDLVDELENYIRRNNYYFTYQSWLVNANKDKTDKLTKVPLEALDEETLRSYNWFRGEQFVTSMIQIARLLACYQSIPLQPLREYTMNACSILCLVDDVRDDLSRHISSGEMLSTYLLLALRLRENLSETEANQVTKILHECYGKRDQDDTAKVKEMYLKYKVPEMVIARLKGMVDKFENTIKPEAVEKCNVPPDLLDFSVSYMLCNEPGHHLREQILALEVEPTSGSIVMMIVKLLESVV